MDNLTCGYSWSAHWAQHYEKIKFRFGTKLIFLSLPSKQNTIHLENTITNISVTLHDK